MHSCAFYMEIPLGNTPIFQIATCSMTKCSASRSINSLVKGEISTAGIISGVGGGGGIQCFTDRNSWVSDRGTIPEDCHSCHVG